MGCNMPENPDGVNRTQNTEQPLTYLHLDTILDNMLAEIDKQEKLVDDAVELQPACVNTFSLNPSTDALVELPITNKDIPKSHINTFEFGSNSRDPKTEVTETFVQLETVLPAKNIEMQIDEYLTDYYLPSSSKCVNTFSMHPSDDALIELPVPVSKKKTHMNVYDFGTVEKTDDEIIDQIFSDVFESENTSDVDYISIEPISLPKNESQNDTFETSQKSEHSDVWWEGTFRDEPPQTDEEKPKQDVYSKRQDLTSEDLYNTYSSSDEKSTDYSSDSDEYIVQPVKADVKLLVKTVDNGKEEIELRSVREILNQLKPEEKNKKKEKKPCKIYSSTLPHSFGKTMRKSSTSTNLVLEKPTFTLQRLFVRSPGCEPSFINNLQSSKELSKSQPELVASSNIKYPLQYTTPIDLHANAPFYPCYSEYNKFYESNPPQTDSNTFPSAYCDWLLPSDPEPEGKVN